MNYLSQGLYMVLQQTTSIFAMSIVAVVFSVFFKIKLLKLKKDSLVKYPGG